MGCNSSVSIIDTTSIIIAKTRSDEYYIEQANAYFDSLDTTKDNAKPKYHKHVARFEWPPWLLLTGLGREQMSSIDKAIRLLGPCICVDRNHKVFSTNPFVRSLIKFYYGQDDIENKTDPLRIYEEFTFSAAGEITFVEAWWDNDYKNILPPLSLDGWPIDQALVSRLSTKIPGLGSPKGLNIFSNALEQAGDADAAVEDFRKRALAFPLAVSVELTKQLFDLKRPKNIPY